MGRGARTPGVLVGAMLAMALWLLPSPAMGADVLPDLRMAAIQDVKNDRLSNGNRVLRYSTIIVNTGRGAFEVYGKRSSRSETVMAVTQRVFNDVGGYTDRATNAQMYFAGDGHTHWHVRDLETSELIRLDNGAKVGTGAKRGFCFFDHTPFQTSLPGAPQNPVYRGCGNETDLTVRTGLSVGWGDTYFYYLPDQWIDITGLAAGRYRLYVTADAQNNFREANETNNHTWIDLQLKGNGPPKVIGYGPSA